MANWVRRGLALAATLAVGLGLVVTGTAMAAPSATAPKPGNCAIGTAKGHGTTAAGDEFRFDVCEQGPLMTDTTGHFTVRAGAGPAGRETRQGPVVCADMNERTMAFLYTVDPTSQPATAHGQQVLVLVTDGGPNPADDRIQTVGPLPAQDFKNDCGLGTERAQRGTTSWGPLATGNVTVELKKRP